MQSGIEAGALTSQGSSRAFLLHEQLARWADTQPGRRAVVTPDRVLTFGDLHALVCELAGQLRGLGVERGDVVAFQLPNIPETLALYQAVGALGAIPLPLMPALREHDLAFMLEEARAGLFITLQHWRGVDHEAIALASCGVATSVALLEPHGRALQLLRRRDVGCSPLGDEKKAASGQALDAVCAMIFTSGTSGRPKAVLYSHRGLCAEGFDMAQVDGLSSRDVLFVPPLIAHVSGICFGLYLPMALGCTVCLLPVWDAEVAIRTIERERCTWTAGATPFLQGLVEAAERVPASVSSLRAFRCGGASVPPSLIRRARELGIDAYRSYGMSEHPTISGHAGQEARDCIHSDGIVHPNIELRVVDPVDASRLIPSGEAGEIAVRGPDQAVGYLRDADNVASHHDGWLLTGDIGTLSQDRVLTITGRKKDIIIRKGENIAAKEIEDLVVEMEQVKEVAVCGIPDAQRGEMVCCVVVLRIAGTLSLEDLREHLRTAGVATFKWPERLECVSALPYNAGGKVLKTELHKMLAQG